MTKVRKAAGDGLGYYSYLLRLWRESGSVSIQWRASLQDPHSGERIGFAHLDELVDFLREHTSLALPAEHLVKAELTLDTGSASRRGGSE